MVGRMSLAGPRMMTTIVATMETRTVRMKMMRLREETRLWLIVALKMRMGMSIMAMLRTKR